MSHQNLKNHRKFYPLHHFIFYPVSLVLLVVSLFQVFKNINHNSSFVMIWSAISAVVVLMIVLSFMLRQHYALGLQDRLIINEFKFRYFALTGNRLENSIYQFSDAQIFALRFANDQPKSNRISKVGKQTIEEFRVLIILREPQDDNSNNKGQIMNVVRLR